MKKRSKRVSFCFDAIDFFWEKVPEKKYQNFIKMKDIEAQADNFVVDGFPYMLQLEPTNRCNLKCPLCPAGTNQLGRPRRDMPLSEFKGLIDDMEDYLLFIILWEWGEPFMHPELPEMIRYAADRGIKTLTSTNAHFLHDESYLRRILSSGLDTLIIAIDSLEQERYAVYRQSGALEKAIDGLKTVLEIKRDLKSKTRINLRMVIMKQNEHELPALRKFAKEMGVDLFTVKSLNPSCGLDAKDDELVPVNPHYRRYNYTPNNNERVKLNVHCRKMTFMCSISANGEVVPCGYDFTSELKIGNIEDQALSEIWNSKEAQALRKKLYYEKDRIPKCAECSINYELSSGGWFPEKIVFNERKLPYKEKLNRFYMRCRRNKRLYNSVSRFFYLKKAIQSVAKLTNIIH